MTRAKAGASSTHSKRWRAAAAFPQLREAFGVRGACSRFWFMESFHGFKIAHWDHEPTPNPSQEGNCGGMHVGLFPSWEGSGVGRFMESFDLQLWTHIGAMNRKALTIAHQRFGVRWVRGEGTHRFGLGPLRLAQSGVSPVPRQPPHSKTWRRFGRFMEKPAERLLLDRLQDHPLARIVEDDFETAQHSHANVASEAVVHGRSFEETIRRQVIESQFA